MMHSFLLPGEDGSTRTAASEACPGLNAKNFHPLAVDDIVCARVTRTGIKQVTVDLIYHESASGEMVKLCPGFRGTIRATDIPQVTEFLHIMFKPDTHFKAKIIGIGEVSSGFILLPLFE